MNCREADRLLNAYVDDELELSGVLALEDHLTGCHRCRARHESLRALRSALRRSIDFRAAPTALLDRIRTQCGPQRAASAQSEALRGRRALIAACGALLLAAGIGAYGLIDGTGGSAKPRDRVVYHISQSDTARAALRTLSNHLEASPGVKIVVVTHNNGVDFLLRGARDESGEPYEAAVKRFSERGVEFRVCSNTLVRRNLGPDSVLPEATLVPSGIAEIGRLQSEESYAYMRL
jgi:intracellular sulfur oxidation DsrE/DsrF family protein